MQERPEEKFRDTATTHCVFPSCERPLRGGVWIQGSQVCTAGFKAYGPGYYPGGPPVKYILTAGHCLRYYGLWSAASPGLSGFQQIGYVSSWTYGPSGDYGFISVGTAGPSYWDVPYWPSQVVWWFVDNNVPIYGSGGSSYLGQYVCHSGIATYTTCGTVSKLNSATMFTDGTIVGGQTRLANACYAGGDSGGPVFSLNYAYGIFTGGVLEQPCTIGYYTDTARVMAASSTWIAGQ